MILVPKPPQMPSFNHLTAHSSHRRAATALVVPHPHRTPGLLSIQHAPSPAQPKHTQPIRQARNSHIQRKEAKLEAVAPSSVDDPFTSTPPPPDTHQRGRTPKSHPNSHKRPYHRSPSHTPTPTDRVPQRTSSPAHPTSDEPLLASQPSGRLARSRKNRSKGTNGLSTSSIPSATPQPSVPSSVPRSIPIPKPAVAQDSAAYPTLSRSAPSLSHASLVPRQAKRNRERRTKAQPGAKASGTGEITDVSLDFDESLPLSDWDMPPSPSVTRRTAATWSPAAGKLHTPPPTAPLDSSAFNGFPFPLRTSTPPRRTRPAHGRSPSFPLEALFASTTLQDGTDQLPKQFPLVEEGTSDEDAPFPANMSNALYRRYANSKFQNSPSPSELPKPKFLGGMAISEDLFGPF